jgi:hypothetical protein
MNILTFIIGCGLAVMTVIMLRLAKKDFINRKLARGLSLTRIRDVQPGLCLVEGIVESEQTISTPYTRTPSVWYGWTATEKQSRKGSGGFYERPLASGDQNCPFVLRDDTGRIAIAPAGGRAATYPHSRILKSESGQRTGIGDRMKKMKEMDRQQYPEGKKKPFFRKLEVDAPLDIPDDLVEIPRGSEEMRRAFRKYYESWVQTGDRVFILGTASSAGGLSDLSITKSGRAPMILSYQREDLTANTFQKNFLVELLFGVVFAALCLFIFLHGFDLF